MTPRTRPYPTLCLALAVLAAAGTAYSEELRPLEFNEAGLVLMAAEGVIAPPVLRDPPYRIDPDGKIGVFPGTGSITYNFRAGDSAVHIAADHVEPAVSIYNLGADGGRQSAENVALNVLSCIGNEARVISGDAKGSKGRVIGKHGGAEHVMVDFPDKVYKKLAIGDRIQVMTRGTGMELTNIEGVAVMNMSPTLMDALHDAGMGIAANGALRVPVTHRVPAKIMGSGLGRIHVHKGDYDINLFDEKTVAEYGLESLRFGDVVAIIDADHRYGRIYRTGAISIGVVVHSRSYGAGHGPGVTTLFSSKEGRIEPAIDADANLVRLLDIR